MAANTEFIVPKTPHIGAAKIGTTSAQTKSDGTSAGTGIDLMYCVFDAGTDGSFVQRLVFSSVASAANTTGVATTLRVYKSIVSGTEGNAVGATTSANTFLVGEISVPAIPSSHSTNASLNYPIPLNIALGPNDFLHVSQHVPQTTNQQWQAVVFGGDY